MPAPICIMASVMMNDGMPTSVTPEAVMKPSTVQAARPARIAAQPGSGRLAMFT